MRVLGLVLMLAVASSCLEEEERNGNGGRRILALLESPAIRETHSIFFKTLVDQGFIVTYRVADDSNINLKKYGSWLYDHLIVFAPSVEEFGGTLSVEGVTEFIDGGGNVLVAGGGDTGDVLREIAAECGFEAGEEGSQVIDHLNFDLVKDDGQHTTVVADPANLIKSNKIVGDATKGAPFLYRGTGLLVDYTNPLVIEILTASSSAYTHKPDEPINVFPHSVGKNAVLIAGLQARNNARVVFSGSLDFFSDEFFTAAVTPSNGGKKHASSGNSALASALAQWCFKQSGVLRVKGVSHHLVGEKESPALFYTIREDVVYAIDIEEYVKGKWVPFQADDVQMEFHRIDPFVRLTLKPKNGRFEGTFKIPDVYGVYQFKVDYYRPGLTRLLSITQFPVRPLTHNQYERFIESAYPYYASAFSMMAGLLLFSFVFLHLKEDDAKKKTE